MSAGGFEAVQCPLCQAAVGHPCEFPDGPAPLVEDGSRRAVHAVRYAAALPPEERGAFWDGRIDAYLTRELELMNAAADKETQP